MELPSQLTEKQSTAIVDCLISFARHGRQLRLQREEAEREKKENENRADPGQAERDSQSGLTLTLTNGGLVYESEYIKSRQRAGRSARGRIRGLDWS